MVIASSSYTDTRYRASVGTGYDGVARLSVGGNYGTGALLFDGRAVLTAAHLVAGAVGAVNVSFDTPAGTQTWVGTKTLVNPNYVALGSNADLAIVWLASAPSVAANRYDLYRNSDEIGQTFTMVGYGQLGAGSTGATTLNTSNLRLKAQNTFDADAATLKSAMGSLMTWSPQPGTQLVADFDSGTRANDALGRLADLNNLGLGLDEGLIAHGDSGGPAFVQGKLAGVAGYITSLSYGAINPDVDPITNSSFGEIAAWQRVSAFQQWIDQSLRANYPNAPTKPSEVKKEVPEGNSGTSLAYFLVQFTGARTDANQVLSVDYATRDGSATAGSDYLAVSGHLNLYPGETQAVIPVEIVGDTVREGNETFYLDVFNPIGASFGKDVVKLTAVRTILDDDIAIV